MRRRARAVTTPKERPTRSTCAGERGPLLHLNTINVRRRARLLLYPRGRQHNQSHAQDTLRHQRRDLHDPSTSGHDLTTQNAPHPACRTHREHRFGTPTTATPTRRATVAFSFQGTCGKRDRRSPDGTTIRDRLSDHAGGGRQSRHLKGEMVTGGPRARVQASPDGSDGVGRFRHQGALSFRAGTSKHGGVSESGVTSGRLQRCPRISQRRR